MINHIAFIMDGNRRYGEKQNIPIDMAYKKGMEKFLEMVSFQVKYNIKETSYYALSNDNYKKRPEEELKTIFKIMKNFSEDLRIENFIKENKIKLNLIGDIENLEKESKKKYLPKEEKNLFSNLKKKFNDWYEEIDKKEEYIVNIALKYDGQSEIINACKKICEKVLSKELNINKINEEIFKKEMWFRDSPADIIVRPGDAPRLSGFMLWDSQYSEIYFTKKLWPELDEADFVTIIEWFKGIKRNFGK